MSGIDRRSHPAGMRLRDWLAADGWRLRRADWPQPQDAARGSLLFLGGRGDFIEKYLEAAAHWHGQGWAVASFDWRGQGRSKDDSEPGEVLDFSALVDDLAALIADWQASNPAPYVVVAHSMGGHLLLRLLTERSVTLAAAVLVAPMIDVNSAPIPAAAAHLITGAITAAGGGARGLWKAPLATAPVGSRRQQVLTSCPERYGDETYWWEQEPAFRPGAPTFGWLRAAYRSARAFTRANLRRIDLPILIVGASADRLVSVPAMRRVAAWLPNARLQLYDDCAHEILRERDPVRRAVLARIDAFFAEQTA